MAMRAFGSVLSSPSLGPAFVVGVVVMLVWRTRDKRYWQERPGVAGEVPVGAATTTQEGGR